MGMPLKWRGVRRRGGQCGGRRGTWLACVALAACVALCALAGCAFLGEPNTTGDLLVRFAANPDCGNFSAKGTADVVLSTGGLRSRVPVDVAAKADGSSLHGSLAVDLSSVSGECREYDVYAEQQGGAVVGYVARSAGASGQAREGASAAGPSPDWGRVEVDLPRGIDVKTVVEVLSDAKFMRVAYDSDDQVRYELTIPAVEALRALVGSGQISASFARVDEAALEEALGDGRLHVRFDRDCRLRSASLDLGFVRPAGEGSPVSVDVDLDASVTFDGYGGVAAGEAAVPTSVRESAVDAKDPLDVEGLTRELEGARR